MNANSNEKEYWSYERVGNSAKKEGEKIKIKSEGGIIGGIGVKE